MQKTSRLVSHPSYLRTSNGSSDFHQIRTSYITAIPLRSSQLCTQKSILCAANRRKRFGIGKSGKLVLESACVIASKLGFLPEPLGLVLRQFGGGNRGGNGSWNCFGRGWSDGWRRRRRGKLGMMGVWVIFGLFGAWFVLGKQLELDVDALIGGLGVILFGVSVKGWRTGAADWILGFCCCAFLVGLVLRKDDFRTQVVRYLGSTNKNLRRKRRVF